MSSTIGNITFDCEDPVRVRDFWAAALGLEPDGAGDGWAAAMTPGTRHPRVYCQRVPESKPGKNRVHLDINSADMEAEATRLVGLGAARGLRFDEGGDVWIAMQDPEGNEFCVQRS